MYPSGVCVVSVSPPARSGGEGLDIALSAGFSDLSEFTRRFRARFGVPPAAYRRRHRRADRTTT